MFVRKDDEMQVLIDIPVLEAKLPRVTSRAVISLDENPDIDITQPIEEPKQKSEVGKLLPWVLTFDLGRNVKVTRSDLNIPLSGKPELYIAEDARVAGDIQLKPGGRVELVGKVFVIEHGVVRFNTGDASNPHLDVTASWRAPDGTIVYVRIRGTFREASLRLSSDPPLADQAQLQALLLGGTTAGGESQGQSLGVGTGAGVLGQLLDDTFLGNVELRTASEQTAARDAYTSYSAAIPLSDDVWFEGSYKRAETPAVAGPQNAGSAAVDWRFRRNWSLRTEVGQLGTKVDLLWRYRY
jgi:translocation and assembly module TamB